MRIAALYATHTAIYRGFFFCRRHPFAFSHSQKNKYLRPWVDWFNINLWPLDPLPQMT